MAVRDSVAVHLENAFDEVIITRRVECALVFLSFAFFRSLRGYVLWSVRELEWYDLSKCESLGEDETKVVKICFYNT